MSENPATMSGGASATPKNRMVAAVLALCLGSFGVHKFYLGQTTKGIIFVLLCWTGVPGILGFIDCIRYLTLSDPDFELKYRTM